MTNLISKHGGYKNLKSFQMAEIVFDLTAEFVKQYIDKTYRSNMTYNPNRQADQMLQAARSGKQNISEGSQTSGTSKQSELRLMDVARASLEELKNDYEDFLRTNSLKQWDKNDIRVKEIRNLVYRTNKTDETNRTNLSYTTYKTYLVNSESAANCLLTLINQTSYLLDQQIKALEKELGEHGDFKERMKLNFKQKILEHNEGFEDLLKQHGLKRLDDGRVVGLEDNE